MTEPSPRPAVEGGAPVRSTMLPYGRHFVTEEDIQAVAGVLRGAWLTTGPNVERFEGAIGGLVGSAHVTAVSSGTAALHCAMAALGIRPGDEVIVPSLTFVATANAVLYAGGRPVFAEVEPRTLTLDPADVARRVGPRTRAVIVVHYGGRAADLAPFDDIRRRGIELVEDAAHALGAQRGGTPVGRTSRCAVFSFHAVKHVTTAEGGAVATDSEEIAAAVRRFRNHGLSTDVLTRERTRAWRAEMVELGYNYRLSDIGAALGTSQLRRLPEQLDRRRLIARRYLSVLSELPELELPDPADPAEHAWHIFPILIRRDALRVGRDRFVDALRAENIGATLHYPPVHLQPYYRQAFGTDQGMLPVTEDLCDRLLTLPLFPGMTDEDTDNVVEAIHRVTAWARR